MVTDEDLRLMDDDEAVVEGEGYTRGELRSVLVPSVALLAIVVLAVVGHHMLTQERDSFIPLEDEERFSLARGTG